VQLGAENAAAATQKFEVIARAYQVLKSDTRRARYDKFLREPQAGFEFCGIQFSSRCCIALVVFGRCHFFTVVEKTINPLCTVALRLFGVYLRDNLDLSKTSDWSK
jgi:curved DNA-binding protein CbpA